jgi:hypothetical protein
MYGQISAFPTTIFGLQASAQTSQGRQVLLATIAQLGHVALWQ